MTTRTSRIHMRTGQFENGKVMVKDCAHPCECVVAGGAIRSKLTVVFIILIVAGRTFLRCAPIGTVLMTGLARHNDMPASKFEGCEVVIEFSWFPGFGGMTGGTICTEAPFMRFVLLMTGLAILRCVFISISLVACFTIHARVSASQRERKQGMIYGGLFPACR